jgi:hypothetical protein
MGGLLSYKTDSVKRWSERVRFLRSAGSVNARLFRLFEAGKLFIFLLLDALQLQNIQARSSAGEHFLDAEGVGGSIPPVPTSVSYIFPPRRTTVCA